jgi:hypothetical protein
MAQRKGIILDQNLSTGINFLTLVVNKVNSKNSKKAYKLCKVALNCNPYKIAPSSLNY